MIQGISQAPPTISPKAMAEKQQELANVILADPAVESLSSFIGADGTNTTTNSGRMSINLKAAQSAQDLCASDVIRRLQSDLQNVQGIQLFMQPVQNITVDDRVSRTQYQYTLEDPDPNELNDWTNRFVAKLKAVAGTGRCRHRPADGRTGRFPGHRSRDGFAAGNRADDDRQHAVRRLRPAADQHDVHAAQPVPRDSRSGASIPARPECAAASLYTVQCLGRNVGTGRILFFCVIRIVVRGLECNYDSGALHAIRQYADAPCERACGEHYRFKRPVELRKHHQVRP